MKRTISGLFFFVSFILLFSACQKKDWDEMYGRPANLAPPIYQQLEAKGNFTNLLACIDKAGYKESLSKGGYWTFFAPDDDAFNEFYQKNGISGINDPKMDSLARKIVNYSLIFNAYSKGELSKYQASSSTIGGADPDIAFKRKTAYYDFVYKDRVNSRDLLVVATNRNTGQYFINDNGNKYLPYFTDTTFFTRGLSPSDYTAFFPNTPWTGFNVVDATVKEKDIAAENGYIHIVDKVLTPLPNLDQYIASNPDYSEFKALLDRAATYLRNNDLTQRANAVLKTTDSVFVKFYSSQLAFAPNNENYLLGSSTDAQQESYSMFVPKNNDLKAYTAKILRYYDGSFDNAPNTILYAFLNSMMWRTSAWPKDINQVLNSQDEPISFSAGNVVEKKFLSNGIFYGTNAVQDANVFRTVYGNAFLDPKYSLMTMALDAELKLNLVLPTSKFTMFMMSNAELEKAGYSFSLDRNAWGFQKPGSNSTIDYSPLSRDRVLRILNTSVISTLKNELDNLNGKGIVESYNGEYIKYNQGKVYASYNEEVNAPVTIDSSKTAFNGKVYYTKGLLEFTSNNIGFHLEKLAASDPNNFGSFFQLVKNSSLYNADKSISGMSLGVNYTMFAPNNAAIQKAAAEGVLPKNSNGTPNLNPSKIADKELVANFIKFHIADKITVAIDGIKQGPLPTLLKNDSGETLFLGALNTTTGLTLTDSYNKSVEANFAKSNNLSNRALIHSINDYLKYNVK